VQSFGWEQEDIVFSDTIRVRCHQLKDGENGCLVRAVAGRDGVKRAFDWRGTLAAKTFLD
jgi:hypothetical protein